MFDTLDIAYAPIFGKIDIVGLLAVASEAVADGDGERAAASGLLSAVIDYAAVLSALLGPELETRADLDCKRDELRRIINNNEYTTVYQPVVELESGVLVGVEALTRWSDGTRPDVRFSEAHALGIGIEVERATIVEALRSAPVLSPGVWLSINVSPDMVCRGALEDLLAGADAPVVLEITEHEAIDDYERLLDAIARVPGVAVAVDDAGAGYASLQHVLSLAPDFVKLDINWVRGLDMDPARQALTSAIVLFAEKTGIRVIAEGVETDGERAALLDLGVGLGQGYFFCRPVPGHEVPPGPMVG